MNQMLEHDRREGWGFRFEEVEKQMLRKKFGRTRQAFARSFASSF
jgi:hypothetical protein